MPSCSRPRWCPGSSFTYESAGVLGRRQTRTGRFLERLDRREVGPRCGCSRVSRRQPVPGAELPACSRRAARAATVGGRALRRGRTRAPAGYPGVGRAISSAIAELVETGRLGLLDRLESEKAPERAFQRLPGVGPELARRIHEDLGVTTMEELELAAHDGRLRAVEGVGEKRARGIRDALAGILGRSRRRPPDGPARRPPSGCFSTWTASTAGGRARASCAASPRSASIRLKTLGSRFWRSIEAAGS